MFGSVCHGLLERVKLRRGGAGAVRKRGVGKAS